MLVKATAAGGHGDCPAMKPVAKQSIWKGAPPPKVTRKPAGQDQSCFDFEQQLNVGMEKASALDATQLPKLQEMMVLNARSSTDENIKKILKTAAVPFQELEKVHVQLGALFRGQCKTANGLMLLRGNL